MTEVIVIGAGGHAAEIDEYIKYNQKIRGIKEFVVKGFLDDNPDSYLKYRFSSPLLGSVKDHTVIQGQHYIIAIAGLNSRKAIVDRYIKEGAAFSTVIHKSAYVSESAIVEEGSIIGPNVNLGPNVRVGRFSLVNARCSLGHDTIIGNYNFISPNVCLSGFTQIGSGNLFGINSATIPGIRVGDRNKVAAGMILDQNIGDDTVVFYRYKEKIIAVPKT
jgi:sugar O-acyltransferase (sialic acid O-acetyltransferase NeuD family)